MDSYRRRKHKEKLDLKRRQKLIRQRLQPWFTVDIWINFDKPKNREFLVPKAHMDNNEPRFRPLPKTTMSEYEIHMYFKLKSGYKAPRKTIRNELKFAIDDCEQRQSHRCYWDTAYILKVLWRAQAILDVRPSDQTFISITFKRFLQNPWGSRQGKTLGFMAFALGYDWAQASQNLGLNLKRYLRVNNWPNFGIYVWYFIVDTWFEIRIFLRILGTSLLPLCPPLLRPKAPRFEPSSHRAKQVALPRFLRRVGGPAGLIQAIVPLFIPWAFLKAVHINADWGTKRVQQSPLESILHKAPDDRTILLPALDNASHIIVYQAEVEGNKNEVDEKPTKWHPRSAKPSSITLVRFFEVAPGYPHKVVKQFVQWAPSLWIAIEPKLVFCLTYIIGEKRALRVQTTLKSYYTIAEKFVLPRYQLGILKIRQWIHGLYSTLVPRIRISVQIIVQLWIQCRVWYKCTFLDHPVIQKLILWLPASNDATLAKKIWDGIEAYSSASSKMHSVEPPVIALPSSVIGKQEEQKEIADESRISPVYSREITEEEEEDFQYALEAVSTLYPGWEEESLWVGQSLETDDKIIKQDRGGVKKKVDFKFEFDRHEIWLALRDQILLVYDAWLRYYGRFTVTPSWKMPSSYVFNYVESLLNEFSLDRLVSFENLLSSTASKTMRHFPFSAYYHRLMKKHSVDWEVVRKVLRKMAANDAILGVQTGIGVNSWIHWGNATFLLGLMLLWLSVCSFSLRTYLEIWRIWKEAQETLYPTRFSQIKKQIELELFAEYQQEYTFFPIWMPTLRSHMFKRYMSWYRWHMKQRIVPKYLKGKASRVDKLRLHRTLVHKNVITPNALLQPTSTSLKQKLGQSDYKYRFLNDTTLSSVYHMMTQYSSGLTYLLTFMSFRHFPWSTLHYQLYTPQVGRGLDRYDGERIEPEYLHHDVEYWPHRAHLLVGRKKSGKTYFVKNVAVNTYLPLVYIDTRRLYLTRRELEMELRFYNDTGMRPLLDGIEVEYGIGEKYLRARILFRVAEMIAPCIVWIPTVQRYTSDWYRNMPVCGTYEMILMVIIEMMERNAGKWGKRQLLIFAGCENTRYLDPLYLERNRFTELIRIDTPSSKDREGRFLGLLQTRGMVLRDGFDFTTIRNVTMGYTMRDIDHAVRAVNRMCFNLRSNVVDEILLSDALEVHHTGLNYDKDPYYTSTSCFAAYKVGQAVVKRKIFPQPLYHDRSRFWLFHFYYLSRWYLEIRDTDFALTRSLTLPYLFASLAGIATHDAWMTLHNIPIQFGTAVWDQAASDDVWTANLIARAYVSEIQMLDPIKDPKSGQLLFSPRIQWKTSSWLSVLRVIDLRKAGNLDADAYMIIDYDVSQYRHDEPEQFYEFHYSQAGLYDRVAMYRNFMFDTEAHLANSPSLFTLGRYGLPQQMFGRFRQILTNDEYWRKPVFNYYVYKSLDTPDVQLLFDYGHERQLFYRYRARHMTWNVHYDNLEYLAEHRNVLGALLITKRPIWNPKPLVPIHLDFFDRLLLIDRLVMSYLYTVYVDRPDPSKLIKIRKPFWFRDEAQERIEKIIQERLRIAKEGGEDKETTAEKKQRKIAEHMKEVYKPFPLVCKLIRPNRKLLLPRMYKKRQHRLVDQFFTDFPLETLSRYEVLIDENLHDYEKRMALENFMHTQLANIYNTIYRWSLKHHVMLHELIKLLWQQGVLWPQQLETFGHTNGMEKLATFTPPERIYQNYLNNQSMPVRRWWWKVTQSFFAGAGDPENVIPRHPRADDIIDYDKFIEAETKFGLYFKNLEQIDHMQETEECTYDYEDA